MLVCPEGESFAECRDVTADFSLMFADEQDAESLAAALQESLSLSISDGSLQKIVDEVSVDSQVTILGLHEVVDEHEKNDEPTEPAEPKEIEASVYFQIGLSRTGLEKEEFLTDITAALSRLSTDALKDISLVRRDLMLTATTSGTSHMLDSSNPPSAVSPTFPISRFSLSIKSTVSRVPGCHSGFFPHAGECRGRTQCGRDAPRESFRVHF